MGLGFAILFSGGAVLLAVRWIRTPGELERYVSRTHGRRYSKLVAGVGPWLLLVIGGILFLAAIASLIATLTL